MKIGLLTYHHSVNYGAILQSYATAKTLKDLGHEVEFINIHQSERLGPIWWAYIFRTMSVHRFIEKYYPQETQHIASIDQLKAMSLEYDCLVVGSDQTWNPLISKDWYEAYFLNFGGGDVKRISYASSFGFSEWPAEINSLKKTILDCLSRFNAISIRETSGVQLLKKEFCIEAQIVVDPTMLLTSYNDITGPITSNNKFYCYILNRTAEQLDFARKLGKEIGKKPVFLNNIMPVSGFTYMYPPSVKKWIQCIGGAECMVTDSFHGVVFSILYNRNFIVLTPNTKQVARLYDLMKILGLEDRFFTNPQMAWESKVWQKNVDWDAVNKKIKYLRNKSLDFLKNNLE